MSWKTTNIHLMKGDILLFTGIVCSFLGEKLILHINKELKIHYLLFRYI